MIKDAVALQVELEGLLGELHASGNPLCLKAATKIIALLLQISERDVNLSLLASQFMGHMGQIADLMGKTLKAVDTSVKNA